LFKHVVIYPTLGGNSDCEVYVQLYAYTLTVVTMPQFHLMTWPFDCTEDRVSRGKLFDYFSEIFFYKTVSIGQ